MTPSESVPLTLFPSPDRPTSSGPMVGSHPSMRSLSRLINQAARLPVTVLVQGRTGVGKELVVERLHALSGRKGPLISVNVAALPEQLIESELFGAVRGAYTGATTDRRGLIEASAHGTLYLDEATELPPVLQAKLLRVLETGRVRPIGSLGDRIANIRLVVSVQQDPAELVAKGRWREDFYYRVAGVCLKVPTLSERPSDIPVLLTHFLACLGHPAIDVDPSGIILRHPWPGNVRQLRRTVERALFLAGSDPVSERHLVEALRDWEQGANGSASADCVAWAPSTLRSAERAHIERTLAAFQGDVSATARVLGLSASQLYRRLQRDGIALVSRRRIRSHANSFAQRCETEATDNAP